MTKMTLILSYLLYVTISLHAQPESYYRDLLATELRGTTEHKVEGGRVDIITDLYAIEVKRASDWKHSIGQALWYGLQTNKTPGIILIMKTQDDRKYGIRLQSSLDYAGLSNVKVWFYPEDFRSSLSKVNSIEQSYKQKNNLTRSRNGGCTYWVNTGSKKKTGITNLANGIITPRRVDVQILKKGVHVANVADNQIVLIPVIET